MFPLHTATLAYHVESISIIALEVYSTLAIVALISPLYAANRIVK